MIDLNDIAKEVYSNTIRLGYSVNKDNTCDKLLEEVDEFSIAEKLDSDVTSAIVSNIQDDETFKIRYEAQIKGTEQDEIPDLLFVAMSYCVAHDIDIETAVMNKLRYNRLREIK